ncbi:MAG: 4-oxalocrotonate tautomerase [Ignavibacteria bacterium]|mgnify:CR=1 FL=1|nr:MAG: 4-oxalocrotonate tautomerase [Ignavibacteria bacterium]
MPIITAHILEGRSSEQKSALIRGMTDVVVKTLHVPAESVRIILTEMKKDEYGIGGKTAKELGR